jgi:hypothetical protein
MICVPKAVLICGSFYVEWLAPSRDEQLQPVGKITGPHFGSVGRQKSLQDREIVDRAPSKFAHPGGHVLLFKNLSADCIPIRQNLIGAYALHAYLVSAVFQLD